jgi:hypothetical protein
MYVENQNKKKTIYPHIPSKKNDWWKKVPFCGICRINIYVVLPLHCQQAGIDGGQRRSVIGSLQ